MKDDVLKRRLREALGHAWCDQNETVLASLIWFLEQLVLWNRAYALTTLTCETDMVDRHVMDSLSVLPMFSASSVFDVGSGAGFPGIPLALFDCSRRYILVESNGKKVRFLNHVVSHLRLDHVEVRNARIESLPLCDDSADVELVCRALAPLPQAALLCRKWIDAGSKLWWMGGRRNQAAVVCSIPGLRIAEVHEVQLPGIDAQRHLVCVESEAPLSGVH